MLSTMTQDPTGVIQPKSQGDATKVHSWRMGPIAYVLIDTSSIKSWLFLNRPISILAGPIREMHLESVKSTLEVPI